MIHHPVGDVARAFAGEPWGYPARRAVELGWDAVEALTELGYRIVPPPSDDHVVALDAESVDLPGTVICSCSCGQGPGLVSMRIAKMWRDYHLAHPDDA